MLRSLYSGVSAIKANQVKLDVIGNNIANVGTTAFKGSRVRFQDMVSQRMSPAIASGVNQGGVNLKQIGLGVQIAGIDTMVGQGMMQPTSRNLDVAMDGEGYLMLAKGLVPEGIPVAPSLLADDVAFATANVAAAKAINSAAVAAVKVTTATEKLAIDTKAAADAAVAKTDAAAAKTAADTAKTAADTAKTAADTAKTDADAAKTAADTAKTDADTAVSANSNSTTLAAQTAAIQAVADAIQAVADATQAVTDAGQAVTDAGQAVTDAGQAVTGAGQAVIDANLLVGPTGTSTLAAKAANDAAKIEYKAADDAIKDATAKGLKVTPKLLTTGAKGVGLNTDNTVSNANGLALAYTRDGALTLDSQGNLLNSDGLRVLGYAMNDGKNASIDYDGNRMPVLNFVDADSSSLTTEKKLIPLVIPDEIQVNTAASRTDNPDGTKTYVASSTETLRIDTFYIEKDGTIKAVLEDGSVTALGQIAVSSFKNPAGLEKLGGNSYMNTANSGDAVVRTGVGTLPANDNSESYGDMLQGMLEMSNVDLAESFTDMIITTRAFQAAGKTITTGDEILQEIINLKR